MKRIWLLWIFIACMPLQAQADTIYLKDGTVVEGEITSKRTDAVVINVKGVPKRFFVQEIDAINESETEMSVKKDYTLENLRPLSEIPESKVKLILKFLEVDGTKKRMQENLKVAIANAPEARRPELQALIRVDEILEQLVPMYDKVFSESELEEVIMFYESFAGQKLVEITPIILNETVKATYSYIMNKFNPQ